MDYELLIPPAAALVISLVSVPIIGKIAKKLNIIAEINKRTVHHGVIARTGGYAIYFSFIICAAWFLKTDQQINSILIGGFIVFMTGFIDDIYTLKPKQKLLGQILGTLVVIFYGGITLGNLPLSFLPDNVVSWISILISIGWIIGITNAINLIDGLDGLCAGVSMIVLGTISIISLRYGRTDIASLSNILIGAIGGFLFFNFHPAKIFMGDCGALFIGFMIASISLLGFGFKSTAFFTLGAPIVVLT
ncbi:MAG: undecaprenyl/decaprenyl-phosphate alpha-N-acetylglucosaminyl 1-phosphate transferase, partial [Erysipelotrichaceae bacterium]|nr:undecaprenyl/decaprenyl-phosphate alpha-N-acetylglucosaminyl 1-phosphate transferase [Erysipelotrichaceae bacterium]